MIDRGKTAVSAAEEMAFGGTDGEAALVRDVVERRLSAVTAGPWWRSCGPFVTVSAPRDGTRSSSARDGLGRVDIRLSDEQLTLATAAHELAHALAGVGHGHDSLFRAAYVDVVAVVVGAPGARALMDALEAMGAAAGERSWPAPYWAVGDGFVVMSAGSPSVP